MGLKRFIRDTLVNALNEYDMFQLYSAVCYQLVDNYCEKYSMATYPDIQDENILKIMVCKNDSSSNTYPMCVGIIPADAVMWVKLHFSEFLEQVEAQLDKRVREFMLMETGTFKSVKTEDGNPGTWNLAEGSFSKCMKELRDTLKSDGVDLSTITIEGDIEMDREIKTRSGKYEYKLMLVDVSTEGEGE